MAKSQTCRHSFLRSKSTWKTHKRIDSTHHLTPPPTPFLLLSDTTHKLRNASYPTPHTPSSPKFPLPNNGSCNWWTLLLCNNLQDVPTTCPKKQCPNSNAPSLMGSRRRSSGAIPDGHSRPLTLILHRLTFAAYDHKSGGNSYIHNEMIEPDCESTWTHGYYTIDDEASNYGHRLKKVHSIE